MIIRDAATAFVRTRQTSVTADIKCHPAAFDGQTDLRCETNIGRRRRTV